MRPTPEYERHHDTDVPRVDGRAFRPGWRVRSRLDRLLVDGWIAPGAWQAACDFRASWGAAFAAGASPLAMLGRSGADRERAMLARVTAATRIRALAAALGPGHIAILVCVVVDDLSWRDLGRRLRCHHETARDAAIDALGALAARSGHVLTKSTGSEPIRTRQLQAFRQCANDFANLAESDHGAAIDSPIMADKPEPILQFFAFDHLPDRLQAVSRPFGVLAQNMVETLPRNPERTVALRKLLEAKDAAVRALIYEA